MTRSAFEIACENIRELQRLDPSYVPDTAHSEGYIAARIDLLKARNDSTSAPASAAKRTDSAPRVHTADGNRRYDSAQVSREDANVYDPEQAERQMRQDNADRWQQSTTLNTRADGIDFTTIGRSDMLALLGALDSSQPWDSKSDDALRAALNSWPKNGAGGLNPVIPREPDAQSLAAWRAPGDAGPVLTKRGDEATYDPEAARQGMRDANSNAWQNESR